MNELLLGLIIAILNAVSMVMLNRLNREQVHAQGVTVVQAVRDHVNQAIQEPVRTVADNTSAVSSLTTTLQNLSIGWQANSQYLIEANTRLVERLNKSEGRIEDLQAENAEHRRRIETYSDTLNKLVQDQERRAQESRARDDRIEALQRDSGILHETLAGTQKELLKAKEDLVNLRRDLEGEQHRRAEAEGRIQQIEQARALEQQQAQAEQQRLQKEIETKDQIITDLQKRVNEQEDQIKDLEKKMSDLQDQLNAQKVPEPLLSPADAEIKP